MDMKRHIPSPVLIAGHSALIAFEGQPVTCYICKAPGHLSQTCPQGTRKFTPHISNSKLTWAQLTESGEEWRQEGCENT
jgi:hypothetical protein